MAECTDCCLLQTSDRASSQGGAGIYVVLVYYEYQIEPVAVGKTRKCTNIAYYEYQIALVNMRKTQKCAKPWLITNTKSHLKLLGKHRKVQIVIYYEYQIGPVDVEKTRNHAKMCLDLQMWEIREFGLPPEAKLFDNLVCL